MLARAARLYPVQVHAFAFLSNHFHLLLTVPSAARLAEFMGYLNSNLARELGRLSDWRDRFWARRYQVVLVAAEPAAQIERLRYVMSHGCKENLVRRPQDWPGAHCIEALLTGREVFGTWVDRTAFHRSGDSRRGRQVGRHARPERLRLSPLPCWSGLDPATRVDRVRQLLESIEEQARAERRRTGLQPVGVAHVASQEPHERVPRPRRGPAPFIHAATRSSRAAARALYREFVATYRAASVRFRRGESSGELSLLGFPAGSFLPPGPFVPAPT